MLFAQNQLHNLFSDILKMFQTKYIYNKLGVPVIVCMYDAIDKIISLLMNLTLESQVVINAIRKLYCMERNQVKSRHG